LLELRKLLGSAPKGRLVEVVVVGRNCGMDGWEERALGVLDGLAEEAELLVGRDGALLRKVIYLPLLHPLFLKRTRLGNPTLSPLVVLLL